MCDHVIMNFEITHWDMQCMPTIKLCRVVYSYDLIYMNNPSVSVEQPWLT